MTPEPATPPGPAVEPLIALGDGPIDPLGYRWAWGWAAVCFALCALIVVATFPAGNSEDRAET